MPLVYADRVKETTSTTGTGTLSLSGAVTGFQSFGDVLNNSDTCYYVVTDDTNWEVGLGTYSSSTLSRDTILDSSTGSKISLGVGVKTVFITLPASQIVDSNHTHTESDITNLGTYSTATGVEDNADVTDTANVAAAGALMDSEVTNLAQVKAFDSSDYATASHTHTESDITDLGSYLTAETNDLSSAVTWVNVPDANITESSVTQHEAALSVTESQVTDLGTYLETVTASDIDAEASTDGHVLTSDGAGNAAWEAVSGGGGAVDSVNGETGTVVITTGDITEDADANFVTDAQLTVIGNTSGTNTGDQDISGIATNASAITGKQDILSEGAFTDGDKTKLDGVEASADVTDTANVTSAGALMDSEVTNLAQVKAFDSSDYATAAQGSTADSALQNINSENLTDLSDVDTDKSKTPADGDVLTFDGTDWNAETPSGGGGGGLDNLVEDTSPQLGGTLDSNGNDIDLNGADKLLLDADGDSYFDATTDDQVQVATGGSVRARFTDSGLTMTTGHALNTDTINEAIPASGVTVDGVLIKDGEVDGVDVSANSVDVTVAGEDYLSLSGQEVTANPIDLDNLSASGTASSSTYLRGDNSWASLPAGDVVGIYSSYFQVQDDGTTGQLTTGTAADLTGIWDTPTITDSDFSWNGTTGILTVNTAGIVEFNIKVTGYNNANNRSELHVQIYKNGSTVAIEDAQYATRNNTQDEGSAYINGFKDTASASDTYRVRIYDVGSEVTVGASNVAGQTYISARLDKSGGNILETIYPIGSVYLNATNATNPATLLGFGTWTAFGAGRMPVGFDSGDTDFDTAEETGGSKTVDLSHDHTLSSNGYAKIASNKVDGTNGNIHYEANTTPSFTSTHRQIVNTAGGTSVTSIGQVTNLGGSTDSEDLSGTSTLPPYITVYMWKRTA